MLKIKRTIVHDECRNETVMELEARIVSRHMFRIADEMDSRAIEWQTNLSASKLVSAIITQADGFELLPIEHRITSNEPVEESE